MYLGNIRIMFYGCPENVNLTHSTKFSYIALLKYSFSVPPGNKNNRVYQMSYKFWRDVPRTFNCVLKRCLYASPQNVPSTSILNIIQNTLLLYYFRSYSPNSLHKILKSQMLFVLTIQEKRPANVLKASRKGLLRLTSLRRPQCVIF